MQKKQNNTVIGQMTGFLFQPERALYLLSGLTDRNQSVSIEFVDDVSVQDQNNHVIISEQDKHSISQGKASFGDNSNDLWRTFEIWIGNYKLGLFTEKTSFVCATNTEINKNSLLKQIINNPEDEFITNLIKDFLSSKKESLKTTSNKTNSTGKSIKSVIKKIEFVLHELDTFLKIAKNLTVEENQTSDVLRDKILNNIQRPLNSPSSNSVLDELLGWIHWRCIEFKDNANSVATVKKEEFNEKMESINSSETLKNLIFRAKEEIEQEVDEDERNSTYQSTFVKQIDIVERRNKDDFILNAIIDFLCYEKEEMKIAQKGVITSQDFEKFKSNNFTRWKQTFDSIVTKNLDEYSEDEKNSLAIEVYDKTMGINLKFKDIYEINISNEYIKKGSFHKLADIPKIGWHPDWENRIASSE